MKLLGIDGGGTKAQGAEIDVSNLLNINIANPAIERLYSSHTKFNNNFIPVKLEDQLNNKPLSVSEKNQEKVILETIAELIHSLSKNEKIKIAISMPGIKTPDKRGIQVMINGPRMPKFCQNLEKIIPSLLAPIAKIEDDSKMCGLGEEFHPKGEFKNIENGYYLGGGTGSAECLKLNGKIITFDESKEWIGKAWELRLENGQTLESVSSMSGINKLLYEGKEKEIEKGVASLIMERITTVFNGWENQFIINRKINKQHCYEKIILERIIIGQKLAEFFNSQNGKSIFYSIIQNIEKKIIHSKNDIKDRLITNNALNNDLIVLSNLRTSPIIGLGSTL
tara:strand:+ start:973 stop:1986 length:1014 start_codon:yes stop_codon:yes gene_type:complete